MSRHGSLNLNRSPHRTKPGNAYEVPTPPATAEATSDDRSRSNRAYTLEELCWEYWQQDQRGFMSQANGDCTYLRVFIDSFKRKESGEGNRDRGHRGAGDGIGTRGRGAEGKLAR